MSREEPKPPEQPGLETDPRFPSGEWTGFFLQPVLPGHHWMELHLTFQLGILKGEGRDWVGKFFIKGHYQVDDGKCWWHKTYVGKHSIWYKGFNEGKGIWGVWEFEKSWKGGFHIWPVAMGDPTKLKLSEAIEVPAEVESRELEPVGAEVGETSTVNETLDR